VAPPGAVVVTAGDVAVVGGTLDDAGVVVVLGADVLLGDPPSPLLPHPTANTSAAAPPNSAMAVLASDFIDSHSLSRRRVCTRDSGQQNQHATVRKRSTSGGASCANTHGRGK
jgi:hypothetical protein